MTERESARQRESKILRRNVKHFQFKSNSNLCYGCGVVCAHICQYKYVTTKLNRMNNAHRKRHQTFNTIFFTEYRFEKHFLTKPNPTKKKYEQSLSQSINIPRFVCEDAKGHNAYRLGKRTELAVEQKHVSITQHNEECRRR